MTAGDIGLTLKTQQSTGSSEMATVSETIPNGLKPQVDAALHWFNSTQDCEFEVTGILDADDALAGTDPLELRLVLCGGDTCQQQSFKVAKADSGFDIQLATTEVTANETTTQLQAELDPPPGPRRGWLDSVLAKHPFVVLVFYRGFW
ncbi:MAG: hypothetical protein ACI8W3_000367 [Myxococcota bacterium]